MVGGETLLTNQPKIKPWGLPIRAFPCSMEVAEYYWSIAAAAFHNPANDQMFLHNDEGAATPTSFLDHFSRFSQLRPTPHACCFGADWCLESDVVIGLGRQARSAGRPTT